MNLMGSGTINLFKPSAPPDELSKILNGKVGFNDTIGGGATFYITIPLK